MISAIGHTMTRRLKEAIAAGLLLAVMLACAAAQDVTPAKVAPVVPAAAPVCVAVVEPDVRADLPPEQCKALAAALDSLLTEALAARGDVTLVDRQLLEKVLAERTSEAAGAARLTPGDVREPLRPFWSAGVLISAQVDANSGAVILEAVSAQTGQLLAAVYVTGKLQTPADVKTLLEPKLPAFCAAATETLVRMRGRPLVEVSGRLADGLERSQWFVNDACEAARARVAALDGLVLLVPRQPLHTREERLLRVIGLSRQTEGDAAASLNATPDATVMVTVTERAQAGLSFEDTPIELTLRLGDASETFPSTAGQFDECLKAALAWLDPQLRHLSKAGPADPHDIERARQLAKQTLSAVGELKDATGDTLKDLPAQVRSRLLATASRATHLDPTDETAAWLLTVMVVAGSDPDAKNALEQRRVMTECQRYLDRFPKAQEDRREFATLHCKRAGLWALTFSRRQSVTFEEFLNAPDADWYAVARPTFRSGASWVLLTGGGRGNSYHVMSRQMIRYLIPHIPPDKLDEEYRWWQHYFTEEVARLPAGALAPKGADVAAPWELIDAAFAVCRNDVAAVRAKLRAAAAKVPRTETWIWGGDQYNPYLVPIFLRAAGDPEWQTWNLAVDAPATAKVTVDEMTAFMRPLSAASGSADCWDLKLAPEITGTELIVPELIRQAGFRTGSDTSRTVEALAVAAGDLWMATPATRPGSTGDKVRVFTAKMTGTGDGLAEPAEVLWPEADCLDGDPILTTFRVTTFGGKTTVWLGTQAHGLARFDRIDGRWVGRWHNTRHGLPSNGVTRITTCRNQGRDELLVIDLQSTRSFTTGRLTHNGPLTMVWTLDPTSGKSTLVYDGQKDAVCIGYPAAEMADGRKVLMELLGEGLYDGVPDVSDIRRVVASDYWSNHENPAPFTSGAGGARLWKVDSDKGGCMVELSTSTLKAVRGSGPGDSASRIVNVMVDGRVDDVLGAIAWWPGSYSGVAGDTWPKKFPIWTVGRGDVLWMAYNSEARSWDYSRAIVGYRPAPPGAKDWSAEDLWIGPFVTPGSALIYGLRPEGKSGLLLSTGRQLLQLDSEKLIEQARAGGLLRSTAQWRAGQQQRLADMDWRSLVPRLILDGQWAEAGQALDRQGRAATAAGASDDELRVMVWRARLLAAQKDRLDEALAFYDRVAEHPRAGAAGEAFARANQIVLLHRAGRWQELAELAARAQTRFPQMDAGGSGGPKWYLAEARKRLAAAAKDATAAPAETSARQPDSTATSKEK